MRALCPVPALVVLAMHLGHRPMPQLHDRVTPGPFFVVFFVFLGAPEKKSGGTGLRARPSVQDPLFRCPVSGARNFRTGSSVPKKKSKQLVISSSPTNNTRTGFTDATNTLAIGQSTQTQSLG